AARASPALRAVIRDLAQRTATLLAHSRPFASRIADSRLALEVGVIQAVAENLTGRLMQRDPLSQRAHHNAAEAIALAVRGGAGVALGWLMRPLRPQATKLRREQG